MMKPVEKTEIAFPAGFCYLNYEEVTQAIAKKKMYRTKIGGGKMTNYIDKDSNNKFIIELMNKDFILWRCLHGGPVFERTIDQCENEDIARLKARNVQLLEKLSDMYGACAIIARDGEKVIGQLRFYPKAVMEMIQYNPFCLQQPNDDFNNISFPCFNEIFDKTIYVHCLMILSDSENNYRRKGIASEMVNYLIKWARDYGWVKIEANAYVDLPTLYDLTGVAGKNFWEKRGFFLSSIKIEPAFLNESDFINILRSEAQERNINLEDIPKKYVMAFNL